MDVIGILISLLGLPFFASLIAEIYYLHKFKWYIPFILCGLVGLAANFFSTILFVASMGDSFIFIILTVFLYALMTSLALGLIASWIFPHPKYVALIQKLKYIAFFTLIPLIGFIGTVVAYFAVVQVLILITGTGVS